MVASLTASLAVESYEPDFLVPLLILPATLPPLGLEILTGIRLPASLQTQYSVLLIAGPYAGEHLGLYHAWGPWDKWVHFYSGFFIAFGIVFALGAVLRRYSLMLPPWLEAVIVITTKASIALLWEVAEFIWDLIFGTTAQDHNFDTMTDMILGTTPGVLIAAALICHRTKRPLSYLHALLNAPLPTSFRPLAVGAR